jgi:hypothetical protein
MPVAGWHFIFSPGTVNFGACHGVPSRGNAPRPGGEGKRILAAFGGHPLASTASLLDFSFDWPLLTILLSVELADGVSSARMEMAPCPMTFRDPP